MKSSRCRLEVSKSASDPGVRVPPGSLKGNVRIRACRCILDVSNIMSGEGRRGAVWMSQK
eukprot:3798679-Karenia_brevis.AAC.1